MDNRKDAKQSDIVSSIIEPFIVRYFFKYQFGSGNNCLNKIWKRRLKNRANSNFLNVHLTSYVHPLWTWYKYQKLQIIFQDHNSSIIDRLSNREAHGCSARYNRRTKCSSNVPYDVQKASNCSNFSN